MLALVAVIVVALCFPARAAGANGIEQSLEVAPGGRLEIESEGASIEVTSHEGAGARVIVTRGTDDEEEIREDYRVDITQSGDVVRVELERLRPWRLFDLKFPRPRDRGRAAPPFRRRRGDLRRRGVDRGPRRQGRCSHLGRRDLARRDQRPGDGLDLRRQHPAAASGGNADLRTSGGSIVIGDVEGSVNARTSGGSITIERAAGAVIANTSGGSIEIEEVHGAIDAETAGGSVRAYLSEPPRADSSLRTSGGGITWCSPTASASISTRGPIA